MIDLYKYISEGLLKGMDDTIKTGESDVNYLKIREWLEKYTDLMYVTVEQRADLEKYINSDNTLNLLSFNPWYAYAKQEMEFPVPDYIDIKSCNNISMTMTKDVDFTDLPHIGNVNELLLRPFADDLKHDLSKLPIDNIKIFEWIYDRNDIVKFPKKTNIDTFIMWTYVMPSSVFGHPQYMIGFDKLKGLKCNKLAIPDIIFAEKYSDFNTGYNSMIKKGGFSFDSQPAHILLKLFDDKSIQFNKLYVYSACASNYKFYELKKAKDCFVIAKRGTNLM